jgi:parallel beta-helix repeat protein
LIYPHIVPEFSKAKALSTKQIGSPENPYAFLEIAMRSVSRFSVLFLTVGIVVASTGLFGTSQGTAIAQIPGASNQMSPGVKTMSQVNVLFVNPSAADDKAANGSERAPFKTITQALRAAGPNTVIMLNQGTYSVENGEQFPLILKPGVSLQGDARTKGRGILIQGGGDYLSRSYGGQKVTIVAANQSGLTGVTVTNPKPPSSKNEDLWRGYGVWIESSNPVIVENTFANSMQDGISVNGNSAPTIRNNYFFGNKANGITISGNSRPEVRENIFQQTGFGINIIQNAQPIVVGNQIQYNRSGIVVQGNARPVLRNNIIQNNKEDGLVAIGSSMPDLGSASEPGGNEFRNNTRFDINAGAAKQVISGAGNTLVGNRISGKVEMNGTTASVAQSRQSLPLRTNNTNQQLSASREVIFSAPGVFETDNKLLTPLPRNNTPSGRLNPQLVPLQPANSSLPLGQFQQPFAGRSNPRPTPPVIPQTGQTASRTNGEFPTPSSLPGYSNRGTQNAANRPDTPQMNYVRIDPNTVEFTAPQSPSNLAAQSRQNMSDVGNSSLLPVPDPNVPIGNSGNMRRMQIPQSIPTTAYRPNPSFAPVAEPQSQTNSRFRVMVEVISERDQELVRFLSPGAFSTMWQGKTVMQAGVFSSRYNADGMAKVLYNNGLRAVVEEIS